MWPWRSSHNSHKWHAMFTPLPHLFYFLVEKENKKLEEKDKMKREGKKKESKEEGEGELGLELDGKRTKNGTILGFRI